MVPSLSEGDIVVMDDRPVHEVPKSGEAQRGCPMCTHNLLSRAMIGVAALMSCALVTIAPAEAKSKASGQYVTAVSGTVSGNVQQVGFRAMIQRQAIEYNLAGSAKNTDDNTVRFTLQGDKKRINKAVEAIRNVNLSPGTVDPSLNTFTVVGWTSVSRNISTPYDLVFTLRGDGATIKRKAAKEVWLEICDKAVKGEDVGKCNKDDDE
jgi:acylphosphatase